MSAIETTYKSPFRIDFDLSRGFYIKQKTFHNKWIAAERCHGNITYYATESAAYKALEQLLIKDIERKHMKTKPTIKIINKSGNELPAYKTILSSGMDVRAYMENNEYVTLQPMERALIHTGLYIELPEDMECQVRPRSGLALIEGVTVLNTPGTIDADYRGEIGVILVNLSNYSVNIKNGDRIAQLVFAKVTKIARFEVVQEFENETERGAGGFGHTGKD